LGGAARHRSSNGAFLIHPLVDAPFPTAERSRLHNFSDRILFGSDFPNIPYSYGHALFALERLDLGDTWLQQIGLCGFNQSRGSASVTYAPSR
jgi:hypothetical protein